MFQKTPKQPEGLISVLLNLSAPDADRSDAAMDLSAFDEPSAEEALIKIATSAADADLVSDCCESIGEIWCRKGRFNEGTLMGVSDQGREMLMAMMERTCPELAAQAERFLSRDKAE